MKKKALAISASAASAVAVLATPLCSLAAEIDTFTDSVQVTVSSSCGLSQTSDDLTTVEEITGLTTGDGGTGVASMAVGTTHEWSLNSESSTPNRGTTVSVVCNDLDGWSVYAKGDGGTTMAPAGNGTPIATLSAPDGEVEAFPSSGATSKWAFKIQKPEGSNITIVNDGINYGAWAPVPSAYDKVATSENGATNFTTGKFSTAYKVYVGTNQQADTYTGSVVYTLVHPASATKPTA